MNLTLNLSWKTKLMASAIGLMAILAVVHFDDYGAKASDVVSAITGQRNGAGAMGRLHTTETDALALSNASFAVIAQSSAACGTSFAQPTGSPISVGSFPASVATSDFNLDGKPDVVTANSGSDNVTILLGNGVGGFTQPMGSPTAVGNDPRSVVAGDFNLDGKPDLAVANLGSNNVTILLGNGMGGFTQPMGSPVSVGNQPRFVVTGDFNLDGNLDLATANVNSDNVTILLGNGTGGFTQPMGSPVSVGDTPFSIVVGDFNLDGKPDLAITNFDSDDVTILLGNGAGGFSQPMSSPISVGDSPISIDMGDFNLDGKPDLAMVNIFSSDATILLGNGAGGFTQPMGSPISVGLSPASIRVGDFNLDGTPDFAVARDFPDEVRVFLGNGSGGFTPAMGPPVSVGNGPFSMAVGDFNLDGRPDLTASNLFANNVTILLNTCDARPCAGFAFDPPLTSPESVGINPLSVALGDFNGDGKLDLATPSYNINRVTILMGDGAGDFTPAATSPENTGAGPFAVAVGDFNLDGKSDLAVANQAAGTVTILLGNGTGDFTEPSSSPETAGDFPNSIAIGDFNRDGKPDLAVANAGSNNVTILLGNGMGDFTQPGTSPEAVGTAPRSVAVGDFNLDGRLDLATANRNSNNVTILLGDGTGNFTGTTTTSETPGTSPVSVAVGDFNLDGKPDLARANEGLDNVTILLGDGMGGFTTIGASVVGDTPISVAVGDFNLDGKPDLAVANIGADNVTILLGDGLGNFPPATNPSESAGDGPAFVAVGDISRDGKPDLAVANANSSNVTILLNTCRTNTPPTISAVAVTRTEGAASSNSTIANVNDSEDAENTLTVTVNSMASATVNGVTLSNITVDAMGVVKADVAAACGASNASFTLRVTDSGGLFAEATLNVTVTPETTKPVIMCNLVPAQTANADASCQVIVPDVRALVRAQSSDNCTTQANLTVTQSPVQGSTVSGAGSHPITVTVTDANGNFETCIVAFTVNDVTKPMIICPSDIVVGTESNSAAVNYAAPSVSDNCSGVGAPVCLPPSGSSFPLGVTTVTCSVKDAANNSNSCSFKVTVNKVAASFSDPLVCSGPGNVVTGTIQITNNSNVATNAAMSVSLPAPGLLALPGTCSASVGSCSVVDSSTITYSNSIPAGQTVTITYLAQIGDQVAPGTRLCALTEVSFNNGPKLKVEPCVTVNCPAVGPGQIPNAQSSVSDQKAGSVLIYNVYTSSASDSSLQNTRINLTNIDQKRSAFVHLFFVDGDTCSVADNYLCLTPNQTTSFQTSDVDPGVTGYLVAVAIDSQGCPTNFNNLIGDEFVKFASGHKANLGAEAISAIAGGLPRCDGNSVTAQLNFDGISYNPLPRVLALSNIASRADGNDTMLILNRIGGDLTGSASTLTNVFGIFYDDTENSLSFSFNPRVCQFRSSVTNNFPRIAPRFDQFVPAGRSGWLKLYSANDQAILGAAINFNRNDGAPGAYNQGHNLHKLTLTTNASFTIPVFPPSC
jgi:hypothetical protein